MARMDSVNLRHLRLSLALCAAMSGCTERSTVENEDTWRPPVTWARLADGSMGWSDENGMGLHAERCWKIKDRYRCVQLLRNNPGANDLESISVSVDNGVVSFYSRETSRLEPYKIYPENGYSCRSLPETGLSMVIAEESITLSNDASVSNGIVDSMGKDNRWTADYIREFVASNAPSDPKPLPFNCVALVVFLERANDKAFMTSALSEADVFS